MQSTGLCQKNYDEEIVKQSNDLIHLKITLSDLSLSSLIKTFNIMQSLFTYLKKYNPKTGY